MTFLPAKSRPHVALMIDTSLASGRNILRGVGRYVRDQGPWSLFNSPQGFDQRTIARLRACPTGGIIARIDTPQFARLLKKTGLPVVDVLGLVPDTGIPAVHADDQAIARLAFDHLAERGFRHFAFVGFKGEAWARGGRNWSERRRYVFAAQARRAGSEAAFLEFSTQELEEPWEQREERLAEWLRRLPKPLGVFACNDHFGFDVLEACRRADLHVPDEVSVLGVDNEESFCEICTPPLSSVCAGHIGVGYQAAALLDKLMQGKGEAPLESIRVAPGTVMTRQSSDALAVKDDAVAIALRLIRERSCSGISIDEISRASGTSRSVLQRRFRAALGRSIHDTIVQTRLGHAMDLLTATDMPLSEIAELSGFNHQEYMGVVFRSRLGRTPAQVRRAVQNKPSPDSLGSTELLEPRELS